MEFLGTAIEGLFLVKPFVSEDSRGNFVKTFHAEKFKSHGLRDHFRESYYSTSVKGVIRGMHFQLPPYEHAKYVYCLHGSVLDVVLDLRKKSATFGQTATFELDSENKLGLYIPAGLAHGFYCRSEDAVMIYNTTSEYNSIYDTGIRYDSFNYHWPVSFPVVSERDQSLLPFEKFKSPF